jgi:hypothetical protein
MISSQNFGTRVPSAKRPGRSRSKTITVVACVLWLANLSSCSKTPRSLLATQGNALSHLFFPTLYYILNGSGLVSYSS